MEIKIDNESITLNDTYQIDHFYKSISDLPVSIYNSLLENEPYIKNDYYTCYEEMTFIDLEILDDNLNKFNCHVSFNGNQLNNDCLFEWIADQDLRIELV